jgi:hypothetical protein
MRLMNTPEAKTERERLNLVRQERLQRRFEAGDPTLRKTIFGNISHRRTGGLYIESAEGLRFSHTSIPLPVAIGKTTLLNDIQQSPIEAAIPEELSHSGQTIQVDALEDQ